MEEAAFMDEAVFKEVVIPLLGVSKTATLAISTPDDEFNHYTKLMELEVDGKKVFKVIKVGLSCGRCLRRGITCIHRRFKLPAWKDASRQHMIEAMYGGSEADRKLMLRETHGQTISEDVFMFKAYVAAMRDKKPWAFKEGKPQIVYIGIDPAGGGADSDYTIASIVFDSGKTVVSSLSQRHNTLLHAHNDARNLLECALSKLLLVHLTSIWIATENRGVDLQFESIQEHLHSNG